MSVIRVSNHCTDVSTWKERYGSINPSKQLSNKEKRRCRGNYAGLNDKYFQKKFYSIVIFDPTTDGVQNSGDVNDGSIFVKQIVYDATKMTNENLVECENFIKTIASGNITENINRNRNMNKKRIRLTESQLHRVIKESVKRVLNELDYRTYINAAKKAREQGRDSRWDFDRAAERAFNKQHPESTLNVSTEGDTIQRVKLGPNTDDYHMFGYGDTSDAWRPYEGHEDFGSYASGGYKGDGRDELDDFMLGKSKYTKGKGWG